jgi:hypothetical protein
MCAVAVRIKDRRLLKESGGASQGSVISVRSSMSALSGTASGLYGATASYFPTSILGFSCRN